MMTQSLVISDSLNYYLAMINDIPLLSKEEEFQLAKRWRDFNDIKAAHKLVLSNLRFVVKIAREYLRYGFHLIELIQEGNIGLMQAVKRFNPEKGYRLISYAVWWIRSYIQSFILKNWKLVKIGTTQTQRRLFYSLSRAQEKIRQLTHGDGTDEIKLIASELNTSEKEVEELDARIHGKELSIYEPADKNNLNTIVDKVEFIEASQEDAMKDMEIENLVKSRLDKILPLLNEREKFLLKNRLYTDEPITMQEIGDKWGISRERVRQLESRLKRKLRQEFDDINN